MSIYETEHYIFHTEPGSLAERDIERIAKAQEGSFRHIHNMLDLSLENKITYRFFDSRENLAKEYERQYGTYFLTNGLFLRAGMIWAVYNDEIKCIGAHEDTHAITNKIVVEQTPFFLEEGVACAMDSQWWGIDNHTWVAHFRKNGMCPSVAELLCMDYEDFYAVDDRIAYPLAGSFVSWLLMRFGKEKFFQLYTAESGALAVQEVLGLTLADLEEDYFQYIDLLRCDKIVFARIDELIAENTN